MNSRPWKKIKLNIGDMVIKYDNGMPEQGILHKKQQPYYDERRRQHVGTLWEIIGWQSRILESFLKKKISEKWIEHYPAGNK